MSERHVSDELPRMLTGDADRETVIAAAAHLRTCPDCQQELVSAVVAHASLASAHRFAPEVVAQGDSGIPEKLPETASLPDLSDVFAQARKDAIAKSEPPARNRRRLVAIAAAAAVVLGGGGTIAGIELTSSDSSSRTVQLDAFGVGTHKANITIQDSKIKVDASALPRLDAKHYYELWVTDSERKHMQPVGSIGSDNTAVIPVAAKVMAQYNDFEVSIQKTNQIKYSGVSVLRGAYG